MAFYGVKCRAVSEKLDLDCFLYCSFEYQKIEKKSTSPICHVVAEADRYVPGLATAKSRVLKLEELAKICSVQY